MSYAEPGQAALNYFPCRYGRSKLLFRGPRRRLQGDYVAFLGGTETYGRFIDTPFPMLLEHETGVKSVNLGCVNAGVDAFANDRCLVDICAGARVTIIEVLGAQTLSNRYYTVHPRRNDRFLRATALLENAYPGVDFTEFSFTRHLLGRLVAVSPQAFAALVVELQEAWVGRMMDLVDRIGGQVVLLWLADHAPGIVSVPDGIGPDPLFIDRSTLDRVACRCAGVVEVVATDKERRAGMDEMIFAQLERPAAQEMLGPVVHRKVVRGLAPVLTELV